MPFVPAPNIVSVELRSTLSGVPVENRLHVNVFHTPVVADMNAIAGALATAINADWIADLPTTWVMNEIFIRSQEIQNGPQATYPQSPTLFTGTHGSPQLPNSNTLCVSLRSTSAGRSARGRFYWQALCEDQVTDNFVLSTPAGNILNDVISLNTAINGLGYQWQIVSYIANGAPRVGGPVYFPIAALTLVDLRVDSQRGRMP